MRKLFTTALLVGIIIILPSSILAQAKPNKIALHEFSKNKEIEFKQKKSAALEYANQNNIQIFIETDDKLMELMHFNVFGEPQYYQTENSTSVATMSTNKVHPGGSYGLSLDGSGMTAHVWDGGAVLSTHQEFGNRINQVDGVSTTHYHATHVGGTMIASGVQATAKGMAPAANLDAYDWNYDESEMATAAAAGALVSNHSYGYANGWGWNGSAWVWYGTTSISTVEDYSFGFYDTQARDWDQIASDAPGYLIVKSAGNDRGDGPSNGTYPQDGPYDCIGNAGVAKNILTVAAVEDIPGGYSQASDVVMSSFSSWGPCDDGRIKPDISTNGVGLYSTDDDNDTDYQSLSGTSMAAPSATGSLILLQQHYQNLNGNGNLMTAATLKAIVIHTADEAGPDPGPDYMFGWGLMNTLAAAQKITEDQSINVIDELTLGNGNTYTRTIKASGNEPLVVSMVWTDQPATPVTAALDPIDPMIVNELDIKITESTNTYYPWQLNRNNPSAAATRSGENNIDNVEMVVIDNPVSNTEYTIIVDHDGTLIGGAQGFSIVISGIIEDATAPPVADFIGNPTSQNAGKNISFNDQSSNFPTSWNWVFTGGTPSSSTNQNPTITYTTPGTYTVELTASNDIGTNTETKVGYITITDAEVEYCTSASTNASYEWCGQVDFNNFSNTSGSSVYTDFTNLEIQLTANEDVAVTLTPAFSSSPYTEYWKVWIDYNCDGDFADAGEEVFSPAGSNTTVTGNFTTPAYASGTTRMRVSMKWNASQTSCETFSYGEVEDYKVSFGATVAAPVAAFSASATTVTEGETIQFTDNSTNNPTSWNWTFDGGSPASSSSQNPLITYNTAGEYSVSLTASNAAGSDNETLAAYITVYSLPLCADAVAPINGTNDVAINTNLEWSTVANAAGYKLYFGTDNPPTTIENGIDLGDVTTYNPAIDLNNDANYYWKVVPYSLGGNAIGCDVWNFTTILAAPVAEFTADFTTIVEGESIQFTDLSSNNPSTWSWTFNGGSPVGSSVQNPFVKYNSAGIYAVSLVASNPGGSDTETKTSYITVYALPHCVDAIAPLDGANEVSISAKLEWSNTSDATGYKLYFGTDDPPSNIENGVDLGNVTSYNPIGDLQFNSRFYWKIVPYNQGGDAIACSTWDFTTEEGGSTGPVELLFTDFESGFGPWTDGGADCALYTSGTYAAQGNNAGNIQDDSGIASSFYLSQGIDIHTPGFVELMIEFDFYALSMDNSNEDFWVQYFDGAAWQTVAGYSQGIDFVNDVFYNKCITLFEGDYLFPVNMKLRFMCDASGNADDVFIDNIRITASSEVLPPSIVNPTLPKNNETGISISTKFSWEESQCATGYKFYLGTNNPPTNIFNGLDLGNATKFNPAIDLQNGTIYYWQIIPYNTGGNATGYDTWTFTTEAETVSIEELSYTDFESGWGIWTDGGGDCSLYTDGTYAPQGNNAANIQDDSGLASSFYMTNGMDVDNPGYVQIDVEFEFIAVSMDNTSEDFWVQYFDGNTWSTVATFANGIDFENEILYAAKVSIPEMDYTFPTDMKIRFMCDASTNGDDVYIDKIRILAYNTVVNNFSVIADRGRLELPPTLPSENVVEKLSVFPNPASGSHVTIFAPGTIKSLGLFDLRGNLIGSFEGIDNTYFNLEISGLKSGVYFIRVVSLEGAENVKLIIN
jgi:PKD repeat protein